MCERSDGAPDTDKPADTDEESHNDAEFGKAEVERSLVEGKLQEGPGVAEGQLQEEASHLVENIKISDPRRGTEVKLLGLRLGENTATVAAQQITMCLQCNRLEHEHLTHLILSCKPDSVLYVLLTGAK